MCLAKPGVCVPFASLSLATRGGPRLASASGCVVVVAPAAVRRCNGAWCVLAAVDSTLAGRCGRRGASAWGVERLERCRFSTPPRRLRFRNAARTRNNCAAAAGRVRLPPLLLLLRPMGRVPAALRTTDVEEHAFLLFFLFLFLFFSLFFFLVLSRFVFSCHNKK